MIDNPKTVTDLAALLNVNRRRITKWRTDEQAPQDLNLTAWRDWLALTGRTILKDRLQAATAPLGAPENHDGAKAAALNDEAPTPPPIVGEWNKPDQDAGPALWEKHYKALSAKQDAANKERAAKIADRDLIPVDEVKTILRAMAVAMLAAIGDHIWLAMRPHLDGMPDTARKNLRTTHDQSLIGVRQRLSAALTEHFSKITNPPNPSA